MRAVHRAGTLLALSLTASACARPAGVATAPPTPAPTSSMSKLPPLLDREVFFGDPEIAGGQISPDGRFIAFMKPLDGVMNLWVVERGQPFASARPVTADTKRPIPGYFWSQDGKFILFAQDRGGDENYRVYAVDPAASPAAGSRVPAPRDLTPYENVRAMIASVPKNSPNHILVGLNDRNPQLHDLYRIDIRTGARELVFQNDQNVVGWVADLEGKLRLGLRMNEQGGTDLLRVDGRTLTPVYSCNNEETCGPLRFHRDGRRVYLMTNKGDVDLTRLVLFDPATQAIEPLESDPEAEADLAGADFSNATDELVATSYEGQRLRIYPETPQFAQDLAAVRKAVPNGDIHFGSATRDDRLHLVSVTSDVDPGATYLYDRETGKVELLYRPRPKLPTEHLATMKPLRYTARDGVSIPAYLTVPRGVQPRGLPTIIMPHGGPWARDSWGYDAIAQFLANRGYAVLQPNFRSSTGFGKKFLNLGNRQWGTGTMQHDLTDAVKYLVDQGIADPKRVGIMGGSYGGYATLAGLAFTPELYAAGASIVGPSSIPTLLRSIPPYWAPLRKLFDVRVGNIDDPKDMEMLRAQSPLYSATRIKAPLLVIQGANDPRVKQAESDQIVIALRDLGRTVDYIVAPDEGHGFSGRENRIAMFAGIEKFMAQHLGGRYQAEMPPVISERLTRLTADVDTVKLAAAAAAPSGDMPSFNGAAIKPMTLSYAQTIEMGAQKVEVSTTRTIARGTHGGRPVVTVVDAGKSPMGTAVDSTYTDAATLLPIHRSVAQGPVNIQIDIAGGALTGSMKMGPQEMPINTKLDKPVLLEGGALDLAVGTLPLAPGYTTTLRSFDLMAREVKTMQLTVVGEETVEVPAGSFAAYRVELKPVEGDATVLWVERAAPNRVVRSVVKLPAQAGGGSLTSELTAAR